MHGLLRIHITAVADAASLVSTRGTVGRCAARLAPVPPAASQITVVYEPLRPDQPSGLADPRAGSAAPAGAPRGGRRRPLNTHIYKKDGRSIQ